MTNGTDTQGRNTSWTLSGDCLLYGVLAVQTHWRYPVVSDCAAILQIASLSGVIIDVAYVPKVNAAWSLKSQRSGKRRCAYGRIWTRRFCAGESVLGSALFRQMYTWYYAVWYTASLIVGFSVLFRPRIEKAYLKVATNYVTKAGAAR